MPRGDAHSKATATLGLELYTGGRAGEGVNSSLVAAGVAIIADEKTDSACHAIELNPNYIATVIGQGKQATSRKATHVRRGAAQSGRMPSS